MAKIANTALTNTFDYMRLRLNEVADRISQFAINNSSLYANTVTANNVLRALGNTVLGGAGKRTIVTGLLSANGRAEVGTNLTVTGNTTSSKISITNSLRSVGNNVLGAAGKLSVINGHLRANGHITVSNNITIAGNTVVGKLVANGSLGNANEVLKTNGSTVFWASGSGAQSNVFSAIAVSGQSTLYADSGSDTLTFAAGWGMNITTTLGSDTITIAATNTLSSNAYNLTIYARKSNPILNGLTTANGRVIITNNLTVSGNTTLGGTAKTLTMTGKIIHTGYFSGSGRFDWSGNTNLGGSGKKTVINGGTLIANVTSGIASITLGTATNQGTSVAGRLGVGTNAVVSGNASVSGSVTGGTVTSSGLLTASGRASVGTNLNVTGNTTISKSLGVGTAASGTTGEIRATNNITAYYSDMRLKIKVGDITEPLAKVRSLSGFIFEPNDVAQALGYEVVRDVGVSAQEIQAVLPEAVTTAPIDDKYLTVRYEKLVPLLVEAIKELDAEVRELKSRLDGS